MDSLHAIGFYVSSGVLIAGGLGVALLQRRDRRGAAMGVVAIGLAGAYLSLSAGFAAAVALICYAGCAFLLASPNYRAVQATVSSLWRQVGALAAAVLLVALAYSAFKGDFVDAHFYGGTFQTAALGRLFFVHNALATDAAAALVLVALVGATVVWRIRERAR